MAAVLELPSIKDTRSFLVKRWEALCNDPSLAKRDERIETNRYGETIMSPPPDWTHGAKQSSLLQTLGKLLHGGAAIAECPIVTQDGVKVADAAWISAKRLAAAGKHKCLSQAPEICVEVISPGNTRDEIDAKRALYFEEGAQEAWICDRDGRLHFFLRDRPHKATASSKLCPAMPVQIG